MRKLTGNGAALDRSRSRAASRGFTIVELMVVIGISVILGTIVLSVSSRVIEQSTGSKCVSNLRQIGVVFGLYAADNNNTFPAANPKDIQGTRWTGDWFNPRSGIEYSPAAYAGGVETWSKITICPANVSPAGTFAYCANYNMMVPSGRLAATSRGSLSRPSQMVVLADSPAEKGVWGGGVWDLTGSAALRLANRHRDKANILWADGHVSAMDRNDLLVENFK